MDTKTLHRLELLNQLKLTDDEKEKLLSYFEAEENARKILDTVDTENVERMVHVMPLENEIREDVAIKNFERDDLQKGAPEATDGYWQVPRTVE